MDIIVAVVVAIEEQWRRRQQRQCATTIGHDITIKGKCVTLFFDDDKDDDEDYERRVSMHRDGAREEESNTLSKCPAQLEKKERSWGK